MGAPIVEIKQGEEIKNGLVCPMDAGKLPTASLSDPIIRDNPNGFYRTMRDLDPVFYDKALDMYLISRHDHIAEVSRDPVTYSVEQGYKHQYAKGFFDEFVEILERDGQGYFPDAIMSDPPYHTTIRSLLDKAFTAHRVKQLEPAIEKVINGLIDKHIGAGHADAMNDLSVPITIGIICEQLGFNQFDAEKISRWSVAVVQQIARTQTHEQMVENAKQICELQNFLIGHIKDREANPKEDLISDLVHASTDDPNHPKLTFKEVVSLVRAFLIAGNDTTATAIGNLFYIFATQPDVAKAVYENKDDDRFMTRFVEELLRVAPPVRGLSRMTTKEVQLGGKTLPKGAHLLLMYASGNDDEREFECPRNMDLERKNLGRHIAFGVGPHRCIGAALARMEVKVTAREIIKRMDNIRLAIPAEEIKYTQSIATRTMDKLPITFTARK